jgi:hypothetical protein
MLRARLNQGLVIGLEAVAIPGDIRTFSEGRG